jgi:hypothetical protein
MLKKKIWANFQRIVEVFTQKIFNIQIYGFGIRKKLIPDPGVKTAPDPGSGSATLSPNIHHKQGGNYSKNTAECEGVSYGVTTKTKEKKDDFIIVFICLIK